MELEYESWPIAGQFFKVSIKRFVGPATIKSYLGVELLSRKDCPDPPCHDMFEIPSYAAGLTLTVMAVDASGDKKERSFIVEGKDRLGMETTV